MSTIVGIIPARYASTRFPGKPLIDLGGKSMIQRVYEQATAAASLHTVVVATDDSRIFDHVLSFGGQAMMTSPDHPSGTDRCAEVAMAFPQAQWFVNIQGDEPFISPSQIDKVVAPLLADPTKELATLVKRIQKEDELFSMHVVKAVIRSDGMALYFSRQPIPAQRNTAPERWLEKTPYYKHIGIYAYRRETLLAVTQWPASSLETAESLEQLRWLEGGLSIWTSETDLETTGIDTPDDLEKVVHLFSDKK